MVELRELRYFVAIAEEGQMSAAARKLHVAQPALSYAITKLERNLGVALLQRHPRGMRLTTAGEQLLEKARVALSAADDVDATARELVNSPSLTLMLGVLPLSLTAIQPFLNELKRQQPTVDLTLRQLDFTTQRAELRHGLIDAEIACPPPTTDEFVVVPLASVGRKAYLSTKHPLAKQKLLSFDQLRNETFWGRHPEIPEDWMDNIWLTAQRGHRPNVTTSQPRTPEEVWLLIASGQAITVAPSFLGEGHHLPDVIAIPLTDAEPIEVALIHRHNDDRSNISATVSVGRSIHASVTQEAH